MSVVAGYAANRCCAFLENRLEIGGGRLRVVTEGKCGGLGVEVRGTECEGGTW